MRQLFCRSVLPLLMILAMGAWMVSPAMTPHPFSSTSALIMTHEEFSNWYNSQQGPQAMQSTHPSADTNPDPQEANFHMVSLTGQVDKFSYTFGPGDVLSILVTNDPTYSRKDIILDHDGVVSLPHIGEIKVVDRMKDEVVSEITQRLEEYIIDPQVDILVQKRRSLKTYMLGSVKLPGPLNYVFSDSTSQRDHDGVQEQERDDDNSFHLSSFIGRGGGVLENADIHHVHIYNQEFGYHRVVSLFDLLVLGDTNQDILIRPSDVVYVPRLPDEQLMDLNTLKLVGRSNLGVQHFNVRVYGLVNRPDVYQLGPDEMTLQAALARSGGPIDTAQPKRILVARVQDDGTLKKMLVDSTRQDFLLKPNDVIVVGRTNWLTRMEKTLTMSNRLFSVPGQALFTILNYKTGGF